MKNSLSSLQYFFLLQVIRYFTSQTENSGFFGSESE